MNLTYDFEFTPRAHGENTTCANYAINVNLNLSVQYEVNLENGNFI